MRKIKAILFDMDGVITLTMPYHFRVWKKVFALAGIHVSKHEVYLREGQQGLQSVIEIFKAHNKPISINSARKLLLQKEHLFKNIAKTPYVPGARTFIRKCRQKGLKLALVTGTARQEIEKILPESILNYFHVIISGSDVRKGKPHPEPYLKALKSLRIGREGVLVIENAPFGITSAVKAGINCIAIETSLPKKYLKGAHHIVQDFKELESYIQHRYIL
ncbi:MAG: HAD family phosphatase [Candidatus Omnitrophota bacterium]